MLSSVGQHGKQCHAACRPVAVMPKTSVASGPSPILKYDGCVYLSDTAPRLQRVIDERRKQHRGPYEGQMFEISPNFVFGL